MPAIGQTRQHGEFALQQINKERGENERVNETEINRRGKEEDTELLKQTEREREDGQNGGEVLHHPVTLCSTGHSAPGLLYPPLAINHLIQSLLNRQPATSHPN